MPFRQYEHLERQEVLKTAVNRFAARLRDGNVIPQHAALKKPSPAYVKIVLTSNMVYGHVNKLSGLFSFADQMSQCGDYEDIHFYVVNVFYGKVIAVYFLPFKKITL